MDEQFLKDNSYQTLLELFTEDGINASSKDEIYGCIFGRDSAITILKILNVLSKNPKSFDRDLLLDVCKRSLLTLVSLQGTKVNLENGEEPGKFIHEYRKEKYDHLLKLDKPWYVDPDGKLRNYDSIDSTPLILIAIYKYFALTHDGNFLIRVIPSVEKGLSWIMEYADKDSDYILEYELHKDRKHGGLAVQSWTDSKEALEIYGTFPIYPIAPVEAQGYAWLSLKLWSDFYLNPKSRSKRVKIFGRRLLKFANNMKKRFNKTFIFEDLNYFYPAQALDGHKNKIRNVTGNPLLLLWASYSNGSKKESILDEEYISHVVSRSFKPDLFDEDAGLRTLSRGSSGFNPNEDSYHNGSFWPKLNGMAHEGLLKWGFFEEAQRLRKASLTPILHFKTPIELYIKKDKTYKEFRNSMGQVSCKKQAWSAAAILDLVT